MRNLDRNARASEPLRSCLTHLWRLYHQVAEGLPDSFVFEQAGAGHATIAINPLRTRTARSPVEDVVEVDSDSDAEAAQETQDRIIADVAMAVASVNGADVRCVIGPGVNAGPNAVVATYQEGPPLVGIQATPGAARAGGGGLAHILASATPDESREVAPHPQDGLPR